MKMTQIFADGALLSDIIELNENPAIDGFTTNPTLMKKAGIENYEEFAKEVLRVVNKRKRVCFEVFADDQDEMHRQALKIASWGDNVYVKIPAMNTQEIPNIRLFRELSYDRVKINVTAVTHQAQIMAIVENIHYGAEAIISIFAGRVSDTSISPLPLFKLALARRQSALHHILWASTREVYNIQQARDCEADIITVSPEIFRKYEMKRSCNLYDVSLETVKMFYEDAVSSGFTL